MDKFKGLLVYWQSENGSGIIVYDQFAFSGKYKLYIKVDDHFKYNQSSDFLGALIDYAKKNYYVRK